MQISQLQRQTSLPSYDNVISQTNYKIDESPPPTYDEIILKIDPLSTDV